MKPKNFVLKTRYEYGYAPHLGPLSEKLNLEENFAGQIVKVTPVRAKNKRWLTRYRDGSHNNNYYRVVSVSHDGTTSVLKSTSVEDIEYEEEEMASLYVNGYKIYDLCDLPDFMGDVLPKMLDKYIKLYKDSTSEESPNFYNVIGTAEALRDFLKEEKEIEDNYVELTDEEWEARNKLCQEVWGNFGKYFHEFWL